MNNNFVPSNLKEAIDYLLKNTDKNTLEKLKQSDDSSYLHHGFGTVLRNSWGLWGEDSKLKKWFIVIGIWHPDDMSAIILESLKRTLNNQQIELEDQIKEYKKYWEGIKGK